MMSPALTRCCLILMFAAASVASLGSTAVHAGPGDMSLELRPSDWLVERARDGALVLQPVVPGTRLRDLSQPGWRVESDLVSGDVWAIPTRAGTSERDDRGARVKLAPGALPQLSAMVPAPAGAVAIPSRNVGAGRPVGRLPAEHEQIKSTPWTSFGPRELEPPVKGRPVIGR